MKRESGLNMNVLWVTAIAVFAVPPVCRELARYGAR